MEYYRCNILDRKLTLKYWEKLTDHQSQKSLAFQKDALFFVFNDTLVEELVLYWIQYKIHWNTRLAASDVFHMFTQSIKFF